MTVAPEQAEADRTVLVLGGGGALGAFQAGGLLALAEAGVFPDAVFGCSVGALNVRFWQLRPGCQGLENWRGGGGPAPTRCLRRRVGVGCSVSPTPSPRGAHCMTSDRCSGWSANACPLTTSPSSAFR